MKVQVFDQQHSNSDPGKLNLYVSVKITYKLTSIQKPKKTAAGFYDCHLCVNVSTGLLLWNYIHYAHCQQWQAN